MTKYNKYTHLSNRKSLRKKLQNEQRIGIMNDDERMGRIPMTRIMTELDKKTMNDNTN